MAKKLSLFQRFKNNNEVGARKSLIEELFYDFDKNRHDIYFINFMRGIFFGFGSVLGGTIVIALLIWVLSLLGHVIPPLGDFFDGITSLLRSARK